MARWGRRGVVCAAPVADEAETDRLGEAVAAAERRRKSRRRCALPLDQRCLVRSAYFLAQKRPAHPRRTVLLRTMRSGGPERVSCPKLSVWAADAGWWFGLGRGIRTCFAGRSMGAFGGSRGTPSWQKSLRLPGGMLLPSPGSARRLCWCCRVQPRGSTG